MQSTLQPLQAVPAPSSASGGHRSAVPVAPADSPPLQSQSVTSSWPSALKRQPVLCPWPNSQGFRLLPPLPEVDRTESSRAVTRLVPSKDCDNRGYTSRTDFPSTERSSSRVLWKGMIPLQPTRKLIDPNYGLPGWGVQRPPREAYVPRISLAALTHVSPPVHAIDYASRPAPKLDEIAPWLQDAETIARIERGDPQATRATPVPASTPSTNTSSTATKTSGNSVLPSSSPSPAAVRATTPERPAAAVEGLICDHIVSSPESIGPSPLSKYRISRHSSESPSAQRKRSPPVPRSAAQEAADRVRMPPPPVPTKRSPSSSSPLPISPPRTSGKERLPSLQSGQKRKAENQLVPEVVEDDSDGDTEVDSDEERDDEDLIEIDGVARPAANGVKRSASRISKAQIDLSGPRTSFPLPDKPTPGPVSVLPMPIPSKRTKHTPKSKSILLPYDQLPTYPLPPLPEIPDPELRKRVFTHISLFEKHRGRFEEPGDEPAKHYEKLEHVGDSILGMVVTTWLGEAKPALTPGSATKLKAMLVSNATLSHFSGQYNLPQRLDADPELLPVLRATTDVRAALVEAYIAAIYYSYPAEDRRTVALGIIENWLREMYEPMFDFCYNYMKAENRQFHLASAAGLDGTVELLTEDQMLKIDNAAKGMALLVTMYCNRQNRKIEWQEEQFETYVGTLCKIKCCVDGVELGEGTRSSKKAAKSVAAHEAAKKLGLVSEEAVPTSEAAFR